jgi:hypothetical protein
VLNLASLSVHEYTGSDNVSTKCRADGLVPEANPENGYFAGKTADRFDADSRLLRGTRAGRYYDPLRPKSFNVEQGNLIIPPNYHLRAQFTQVLDKVVGKGIVVVEDENHALQAYPSLRGLWF